MAKNKTQEINKNSKILLLNLPSTPYQEVYRDTAGGFGTAFPCSRNDYGENSEKPLHPFLPYASSVLLKGEYEFNILDCQRLKLNKAEVLQSVKRENPDIIFSLIGLSSMRKELELLNEIKRAIQNVLIVGVGTVCRVLPDEVLFDSGVDIVLRNDYPYVSNMVKLLQALQRLESPKTVSGVSYVKDKRIFHTPDLHELDLKDVPPPSYDYIAFDGYESFTDTTGEHYLYVPILVSKGCPCSCIYCPYPVGFGKKPTYRSPKEIVDEIEYLNNFRKIKGFLLRTQSFTLNPKHAEEICDEIIQRKLEIAWGCEARVDGVSRELLSKMEKSGCRRIHYGVETGDSELLRIAKPGVTRETIKKAFQMTKKLGILAGAHIILGWPDENLKTLENTYKLIEEIAPDSLHWNFLTPYPGTGIREVAQRYSLILTNDWSYYTSHTVVMKTKYLSANQLYSAKRRIIRNLAKQELWKLILRSDLHDLKKFRVLLNEAKCVMSKILFPESH